MKILKRYKIMGAWYDVIRTHPIFLDSDECVAKIDMYRHKIYISTEVSEAQAIRSLLHEFIHAVDIHDKVDEDTTITLSYGLYQILVDNKMLRE